MAPSKSKAGKPSQKAMLSRALQKANMAVQLDNAQNFEGARTSYLEACSLLQLVLQRTTADEDIRKLEAIRSTYTSRIEELDQMGPLDLDDKALPARPPSLDYPAASGSRFYADSEDPPPSVGTATTVTRIVRGRDYQFNDMPVQQPRDALALRPKQLQSSFSRSPVNTWTPDDSLAPPRMSEIAPLPLSPRIPNTTDSAEERPDVRYPRDFSYAAHPNADHVRADSKESNSSWLEQGEDSGGSASSSVHSRSSSMGIRRKHIRATSGATEAEFDAALDAAVEAAYDDGFEPDDPDEMVFVGADEDVLGNLPSRLESDPTESAPRNEQAARPFHQEIDVRHLKQAKKLPSPRQDFYYDGSSSEDEERMLEEMSRGYDIEDFAFGPHPGNSEPDFDLVGSEPLSVSPRSHAPVDNSHRSPSRQNGLNAIARSNPPNRTLPPSPPDPASNEQPAANLSSSFSPQSVRDRRLSGQNLKELKIETVSLTRLQAQKELAEKPQVATNVHTDLPAGTTTLREENSSPDGSQDEYEGGTDARNSASASPVQHGAPTHSYSNSSLISRRSRNMSLSNLGDASDVSPGTPSSNQFGSTSRLPTFAPIPTPVSASSFREQIGGDGTDAMYFDGSFHSPNTPGSPNRLIPDAPVSLEPCPSDFLLRPFWLMRCLYQTLAHPRGGYISCRLFIPREVWKVRGAKLKNIEDKISACDYLTAALLKLAGVDNCDADAVLEEMQSFEGVLEQITMNLTRKLGNEVGVQGPGMLFKEPSNGAGDNEGPTSVPRSGSVSGKSSAPFSWRRLRTKTSSVGLGTTSNGKVEGEKESPTWSSLPMTDTPSHRLPKRDLGKIQFSGPNSNYMESLARLFDAAQTIDQIARQVEDPGLRHADKTQVGLELCTRHAAEFFAFYICRFVLADLNVLLEKFIKRGSEWAMT